MKAKPVLLLLVLFVSSLLAAGIQPVQAAQPPAPAAQEEPEAERRLVIHPASFTPFYDGLEYEKLNHLSHSAGNSPGIYTAPVYLPQGATILRMGFYWNSNDASAVAEAYLQRTRYSLGDYINMGYIKADGGTGYHGAYDLPIDEPVVDNKIYSYWVTVVLPLTKKIQLTGIYLDYTIPTPEDGGIISIPSSAFQPFSDGYDYENHGRGLWHGSPQAGFYLAPLTLPDGAKINKITLYSDNRSSAGIVYTLPALLLQRTELGKGDYVNVATLSPSSLFGRGSFSASPSGGVLIDYSKYAYWLTWDPPDNHDVRIQGVVIEYTPPGTTRHRVAIPAAGFVPIWGKGQWEIHGRYAVNKTYNNNEWSFAAPVTLPQGMYISKATIYYLTSDSVYNGTTAIINDVYTREELRNWMMNVSTPTSGTLAWRKLVTNAIKKEKINNSSEVYQLMFRMPYPNSGSIYYIGPVVLEFAPQIPWLYMPIMKKK